MEQLTLFDSNIYPKSKLNNLIMNQEELIQWKLKISNYQEFYRRNKSKQETLFNLPQTTWYNSDDIDPFILKTFPADFYQYPELSDPNNNGYLYFILDKYLPLILYIGETKLTAKKRWLGVHDCKSYLMKYIGLNRQYKLPVHQCAVFFYDLPPEKKLLRQWETDLIYKWKPPFNKESWQYWGQPFTK